MILYDIKGFGSMYSLSGPNSICYAEETMEQIGLFLIKFTWRLILKHSWASRGRVFRVTDFWF